MGQGVRLVLMSELMRRYQGGIDYFEVDAEDAARRGALSFAFSQLGKLYDTAGLVVLFWMIVTGSAERARRDDHWFCSELVAAAFERAGRALVERDASYTTPSQLATSPHLAYRFTLKP